MKLNWYSLPEDPDGLSFGDLKKAYKKLWQAWAATKVGRKMADSALKGATAEGREAKLQAKKRGREVVILTKREKAREEASKAGYWSGGAAICVTIMYEIFKVSGFPGGNKWMDFWHHEAVFGVIMWVVTLAFGWVYRSMHPVN